MPGFPGLSCVAHDIIPERFGRSTEPSNSKRSPDDEEVSDLTDLVSTACPTPSPPRTPPHMPPYDEWPTLSTATDMYRTVAVATRHRPSCCPAPSTSCSQACRPACCLYGRSNAGVAPAANRFDAMAQLEGKVKGVPIVSYRKHGIRSSARSCAHTPAPLCEPSAGPSNEVPPMPDVKEEEEAAPEAPCESPADEDDDNDLYAQPRARLEHRLALDGAAELPADV
jgi:hypothetical protein